MKWIGLLKDHPNMKPDQAWINLRMIEVLVFEKDPAFKLGPLVRVHPVDTAQRRAFSTPGWANKRGDLVLGNLKMHTAQRLLPAVRETVNLDIENSGEILPTR